MPLGFAFTLPLAFLPVATCFGDCEAPTRLFFLGCDVADSKLGSLFDGLTAIGLADTGGLICGGEETLTGATWADLKGSRYNGLVSSKGTRLWSFDIGNAILCSGAVYCP